MDTQVEELIDRIKRDGVAAAENSASKTISEAQKEAEKIISNAKAEADKIIRQAKDETERLQKSGEDAIRQAGRNLLIAFRDSIQKELSTLVNGEVSSVYSKDMLVKLVPEVIKEWVKNTSAEDVSVLLNEKDLKQVEDGLKAALKAEISKGLTLGVDNSVAAGFRIGVKDGAAFYDYSADSVAELFSSYLNPRIAKLMKEASK
ncbi:MAG TPA: V-type ATP synthase subunit E [Treponema sp.]|nr:V-type ATP synthase subunit E [Treponema sp.]